jgi:hypothetical protein
VTLVWDDPSSDFDAIATASGGEATLLARLSHAPDEDAAVVLAVSATWRNRSDSAAVRRAAVVLWPAVVVFTRADWDVAQPIKLRGLDDGSGADQYNRTCDVTLTRVGSRTGDPIYDSHLARVPRIELARAAKPPGRQLIVTSGDGPSSTSEAGTEVSLVARLSAPPPNGTVVAFGVSVDDPSEAVIVAPADLRFTRDN